MTDTPATPATDNTPRTGQLAIQKVYVKDLSYEAPNTPQIFTEEWRPKVDIQLSNTAAKLADGVFEAILSVTVTVRFEEKTAYLVEVQQAGIFNLTGFPEEHLGAVMGTICPNILFPFAREVISDVVTKAGFPQLLLAPVNFDAMYAQEMQRQREAQDGGSGQIEAPADTKH